MWCHRLSAVLLVAATAAALRVSFVPAMDGLIESCLTRNAPGNTAQATERTLNL
ncbi:MAG TPA: hypothetical protein V6D06_19905 [Trichocoleus sp.]